MSEAWATGAPARPPEEPTLALPLSSRHISPLQAGLAIQCGTQQQLQDMLVLTSFLLRDPNTLDKIEKMDPKDEGRKSRGGRRKQSTPNSSRQDHLPYWSDLGRVRGRASQWIWDSSCKLDQFGLDIVKPQSVWDATRATQDVVKGQKTALHQSTPENSAGKIK